MAIGSNDLGIDSLSTGISASGMDVYVDTLRADLITKTSDLIDDVDSLINAINAAWQGVARDHFVAAFEETREAVKSDLQKEYSNLIARLGELQQQYFDIDQKLMDE